MIADFARTGRVSVVSYGAFHVVLRVGLAGGGAFDAALVQGSPVLRPIQTAAPTSCKVGSAVWRSFMAVRVRVG